MTAARFVEADVSIVGGGVIGLSIAWELAKRGREVLIVERGEVGREASWAGAGMLPSAPAVTSDAMEQLMAWSRSLHAEWSRQLLEETNIDNGFQVNGALYIARSPAQRAALRAWQRDCEQQSLNCRWLSDVEVASCEPKLDLSQLLGACLLPEEGQLRNPRHLQALQAANVARGVRIMTHCDVNSIDIESGLLHTTNGQVRSAQVVVAAGPWTRKLLAGHTWSPDIYPVRGQMALFRCEQRVLQHNINDGPRYLVPRKDGRLLAGSTEEEVGFDQRTTDDAINRLVEFAHTLAPCLVNANLEATWAGLRPAAFDGFPYLGKAPNSERVFVASGHFRNGLNLSTGTAVLMAELLCGAPTSMSMDRFHVGR